MQGVPGDCSDGLCCVFQGILDSYKAYARCAWRLFRWIVLCVSGYTGQLQGICKVCLETVLSDGLCCVFQGRLDSYKAYARCAWRLFRWIVLCVSG